MSTPNNLPEVIAPKNIYSIAGISRSTVDRLEKLGKFPCRIKLSPGRCGWIRAEVEQWRQSLADQRKNLALNGRRGAK